MSSKTVFIDINSLNISVTEFETIVWNQTQLDEIRKREYMGADFISEDAPLQLVRYLSQFMDPVFRINRWVTDVYNEKKTYDTAIFWLRIFLNKDVSTIFPPLNENTVFLDNIRKKSSPTYSNLIKNIQNF
jgi:hypothetical protein